MQTMAAQLARTTSAPTGAGMAAMQRSASGRKLAAGAAAASAAAGGAARSGWAGKTLVPPPPPLIASAAASAASKVPTLGVMPAPRPCGLLLSVYLNPMCVGQSQFLQ